MKKTNHKWTNVPVGDEWIASYNPFFLLRFDCHIHVDVVTATACFKYLFKYCRKRKTTPVLAFKAYLTRSNCIGKQDTSLPLKQRGDWSAFK